MALDIKSLKRKYHGYWLAIKVTKWDRRQGPVAGILVGKAKTHHGLHKRVKEVNIYETYAGKIPHQAILF